MQRAAAEARHRTLAGSNGRAARAIALITLVAGFAGIPVHLAAQAPRQWPTRAWPVGTPESVQLRVEPWNALDSAIRAGVHGNVDHLVVIRHGVKVIDHPYPRDYRQISAGRRAAIGCGTGACEGFGITPGFNYFDPDEHPYYRSGAGHSLQSSTKSVSATVLAVAMQQGKVGPVTTPMLKYLTAYRDVKTDPRLDRATLADLLTMRSGIEWHEGDRPLDSTNTTLALEASKDWVRFTLSQPMDADPGTKWAYNSGGSHLIGAIVQGATGQDPLEYATRHLFTPLGITDFYWKRGGGGLPDGEGGLYLRAEDLARIGYLYLHDGMWDGRRILPAGWARAATERIVEVGQPPNGPGYGYQWWRVDREGVEFWATRGFGGNTMIVAPSLDLIAVILGWNVFGDNIPDTLRPLLTAVLASAGR